jgi:hypothetical protein
MDIKRVDLLFIPSPEELVEGIKSVVSPLGDT